jgi:hypothetical protein
MFNGPPYFRHKIGLFKSVFEVARGHEIDLGSYAGNSCPNGWKQEKYGHSN